MKTTLMSLTVSPCGPKATTRSGAGAPVISVGSLVSRPVPEGTLGKTGGGTRDVPVLPTGDFVLRSLDRVGLYKTEPPPVQ